MRRIRSYPGRFRLGPVVWTLPALLVMTAFADRGGLVDTTRSAATSMRPLGFDQVHWTDGFWAERFATCRDRSLPAMWEIMSGDHYKPFLQHFLIAAGELEGEHHGAAWNDGDFYKFLEGVCSIWAVTKDPELEAILQRSIEAVGRAQRADGYLHTPVLIRRRNGDEAARPFEDRHHFEMYNMGHLLTAACVHHRVTGREDFLAVAIKTADYLDEAFREPNPELARQAICPSHYMGVIELYRTTREPRYLELANRFLDMRALVTEGGDDNQDRIPFLEQREAVGHAVRANFLYAGVADLLLETGDAEMSATLDAIWANVVSKKMYLTGACGALYDGASPYGSIDQANITRVHQAYGHHYELPNTTAHGETCAAVGSVLWNWRMFLATGEARFVDVLERTLYNAVLAGVSLKGNDYFYVNPLRNVDPLPTELRWSRTRVPFVTSYCCPPNVFRTVAQAHAYAYSKSEGIFWVNLYGGSEVSTMLDGSPLQLGQETDYPWSGEVRLTMSQCPKSPFILMLRIPGWAESATIRLNEEPFEAEVSPGNYVEIRRHWKSGDTVRLEMPMPPRLIEAHPLVEETRNQVALQRGPVVYCLESLDLPEGVRVQDVVVPADAKWRPRHEASLLGGVTVMEAEVLARPAIDWDGRLYRTRRSESAKRIHVSLIPYYAWANRGESEMSVWLPVR